MEFTGPNILKASFEARLNFLNTTKPESVFELVGGSKWIAANVVYNDGAVDIEATSAKMGVPVYYNLDAVEGFCHAATKGILDKNEQLEIFLSDTPHHIVDRSTSFGHELGHILLDQALDVCSPSNMHEELFCDYVGLMISIPDEEIQALGEISEETIIMLCERLNVSHSAVIERLMRANKLPTRIAYDSILPGTVGVTNPYYKDKVIRHVICLPCINYEDHPQAEDILSLPTFDFTSYDIRGDINGSESHGNTILTNEHHRAVNVAHGRWTESDEETYRSKLQ